MARAIVPNRIIVQLENDGSLKSALLSYQIRENDQLVVRPYTVSVKNALPAEPMETIINAAIAAAKESEGIQ